MGSEWKEEKKREKCEGIMKTFHTQTQDNERVFGRLKARGAPGGSNLLHTKLLRLKTTSLLFFFYSLPLFFLLIYLFLHFHAFFFFPLLSLILHFCPLFFFSGGLPYLPLFISFFTLLIAADPDFFCV